MRLDRLDRVIQAAMGWTNSHLHLFIHPSGHYGTPHLDDDLPLRDERKATLLDLAGREGDTFGYEYDLGDGWEHEVLLEKLVPAEPGGRYPARLDGGVHECDAAGEIVEETLAPYLEDVARRLKLGMTSSAHQVAAGVLAGLHACADDHDPDGLLGYAGDMDTYAHSVYALLTKHQQPLPDELLDVACPGWSPR